MPFEKDVLIDDDTLHALQQASIALDGESVPISMPARFSPKSAEPTLYPIVLGGDEVLERAEFYDCQVTIEEAEPAGLFAVTVLPPEGFKITTPIAPHVMDTFEQVEADLPEEGFLVLGGSVTLGPPGDHDEGENNLGLWGSRGSWGFEQLDEIVSGTFNHFLYRLACAAYKSASSPPQ